MIIKRKQVSKIVSSFAVITSLFTFSVLTPLYALTKDEVDNINSPNNYPDAEFSKTAINANQIITYIDNGFLNISLPNIDSNEGMYMKHQNEDLNPGEEYYKVDAIFKYKDNYISTNFPLEKASNYYLTEFFFQSEKQDFASLEKNAYELISFRIQSLSVDTSTIENVSIYEPDSQFYVVDNTAKIQSVDIVDNKLEISMATETITQKGYIFESVKINNRLYTDITTDTTKGLKLIVNDFTVDITKLKTYKITEFNLRKGVEEYKVTFEYKFVMNDNVKHVAYTIKPFIYNDIIEKKTGWWLWEKHTYSYMKYVAFDTISNETGKEINNIQKFVAMGNYGDFKTRFETDTTELVKDYEGLENATEEQVTEAMVKFLLYSSNFPVNTNRVYSKCGIINTRLAKNNPGTEFEKFADKDYLWQLHYDKPVNDFQVIYAYSQENSMIVQGSAYKNGMYTYIDDNGNEVVSDIDGNIYNEYHGEDGIIKDEEGNAVEVDDESKPDTPDQTEELEGQKSQWEQFMEWINNLLKGSSTFFQILFWIGVSLIVLFIVGLFLKVIKFILSIFGL